MKNILFIFLAVLYSACISAQEGDSKKVKDRAHPYLIMTTEDESVIRSTIQTDGVWKEYHAIMIEEADNILGKPNCQRVILGRRLLEVSRECLRRTLLLGYAYRMTGEVKYAKRAESELDNAADFVDWNPSHFLDVAEMTTAMAIGYDWLYNFISDQTKLKIEKAIETKGLNPSLDSQYNSWLYRNNNWNQVCNGGITLGVLAIYDKIPTLADELINRAVQSVKLPMSVYAPDGAYAEGYSYWGYGTTYNLLLIDALENVMGTDYNLSQEPGFLNTGKFIQNMLLSDGKSFNYGDCSSSGRVSPAMFWFANRTADKDILWSEKYQFSLSSKKSIRSYRYAVLALIWGASTSMDNLPKPTQRMWVSSKTTTPVALMRTTWDYQQGLSIALKGGTAQSGHTHLDAGSFIFISKDTRWSTDLGPQDYNSLESKGIDLWNKSQESDRWKVFRYNNLAHNTLSFDNKYQNVNGYATITDFSDNENYMYAIADLTKIYEGQAKEVKRGVAIVDSHYAVVRDEVKTLGQPTVIRWNMVTEAQPAIIGEHTIQLSQNGEKLLLEVESPAKVRMKTWSATSPNSWDAKNPGVTFVGFEAELRPNTTEVLQVKLIPEDNFDSSKEIMPLTDWKNN